MNCEVLANAIIEQAAKDYRWARTVLRKAAENVEAMAMRSETERSGSFIPHGLVS